MMWPTTNQQNRVCFLWALSCQKGWTFVIGMKLHCFTLCCPAKQAREKYVTTQRDCEENTGLGSRRREVALFIRRERIPNPVKGGMQSKQQRGGWTNGTTSKWERKQWISQWNQGWDKNTNLNNHMCNYKGKKKKYLHRQILPFLSPFPSLLLCPCCHHQQQHRQ